MYIYQSGLIDFLSILLFGYFVYLGIAVFLLNKKVKEQEEQIDFLNRKLNRFKRRNSKNNDEDDYDDYEEFKFMHQKID